MHVTRSGRKQALCNSDFQLPKPDIHGLSIFRVIIYGDNDKCSYIRWYAVGRLFVFEGPDGVGKSTVIGEVENRLHRVGESCVRLAFPGKEPGTLGQHIYDFHHQSERFGVRTVSPLSLQLLHVAAHVDAIERRILPLLEQGRVVLLDRYWWSTWVYGVSDGLPIEQLERMIAMEKLVWHGVTPTTLFMLSRSSAIVNSRIANAYGVLMEQEKGNYPVAALANDATIDTIVDEILRVMQKSSAK